MLGGEPGGARELALLNAAAAIYAAGARRVAARGRSRRAAIDSGAAAATLERFVERDRAGRPAPR